MERQEEPARLAQLYAAMSDGELENVAAEASDLTDQARQALRREIDRRRLTIHVHGAGRPEYQEWVLVARFRDLPEAMLAKGCLESAGIECTLIDHNMVRLDWFYSNLLGGVKLNVKPEDVESAQLVLHGPIPAEFDYGEENFEPPRCPKCDSLNVRFESLNKPISYGSARLGVPLPIKSEKWICDACGARWIEEEDEPNQPTESR